MLVHPKSTCLSIYPIDQNGGNSDEEHYQDSQMPPLGTRVKRGPHWKWQNQDAEGIGTVVGHIAGEGITYPQLLNNVLLGTGKVVAVKFVNEMTKITNSNLSHKSYRKYKSENGRTRTSA